MEKKMTNKQYRKELKEVVQKLENSLAAHKALLTVAEPVNEAHTAAGGSARPQQEPTKLYGGAGKGGSAMLRHYSEDEVTATYVDFLIKAISETMNMRVSRSVLLRRCIKLYKDDFERLMTEGAMSGRLGKFLKEINTERQFLYTVANRKESNVHRDKFNKI